GLRDKDPQSVRRVFGVGESMGREATRSPPMDKARDPIKPSHMRHALLLPALVAVLSLGCSSGPPKQVGDPSSNEFSSDKSGDNAKWEGSPSGSKGSEGNASEGGGDQKARDDRIPDDYSLTPGDCDALGKHYGEVAKADQMATVSPKLTQKQKDQAEENIEKVVGKLATQWIEGCQSTLAGNIVDHKALKCAMEARTVADFKGCIGDTTKAGEGRSGGKGGKKN